jgi:Flp pilus assembly protein TadG
MVRDMFAVNHMEASYTPCTCGSCRGRNGRVLRFPSDEQGSAMVELCLVVPILMLMVTGIFSFGVFLRQNLALTDAVNIGAKLLSVNRGNTLDPCNMVYTAVVAAAPSLDPNSMTFSYTFDGTAQSGSSCSSASSTTGPPSELVQGTPISVTVTYPCSLAIYQVNLVPNCIMTAQLTVIEQ